MSVGGGKEWRRWRNVGAIMSKRYRSEGQLRERFGHKSQLKKKTKLAPPVHKPYTTVQDA